LKPRRTHLANFVFRLDGGTEDNDLWVHKGTDANGYPVIRSCWVPTDEERAAIATGANIELAVWGTDHPPVMLALNHTPVGAPSRPR
jgi:hypothetical protein